jgi:hypothetical protein
MFRYPRAHREQKSRVYIEGNTFFSGIKPRIFGRPPCNLFTTNAEVTRLQCVQKLMWCLLELLHFHYKQQLVKIVRYILCSYCHNYSVHTVLGTADSSS